MGSVEHDRRTFMRDGAYTAARSVFSLWNAFSDGMRRPEEAAPLPFLRPPGALSEPQFMQACTRCDECVSACPLMAIRKADGRFGEALRGTPIILPHETACRLCRHWKCVEACAPGALKRPESRKDVRMGVARLDAQKCYAFEGQPCDYCVSKCPLRNEAIAFDEQRRPKIDADECVGCGVCAELCPSEAIDIFAKPR